MHGVDATAHDLLEGHYNLAKREDGIMTVVRVGTVPPKTSDGQCEGVRAGVDSSDPRCNRAPLDAGVDVNGKHGPQAMLRQTM